MECRQYREAAFYYPGRVSASRSLSQRKACSRVSPHISREGCRPPQQAGRSGRAKMVQRKSASRCRQGTPAGLANEEIDGAMQQAAQAGRQAMGRKLVGIASAGMGYCRRLVCCFWAEVHGGPTADGRLPLSAVVREAALPRNLPSNLCEQFGHNGHWTPAG